MSKIKLTEDKLRNLISETINELINEGFLGDVWDEIKTNVSAGLKNDIRNIQGNFNNTYHNEVFKYYGKPAINPQSKVTQEELKRMEELYNKRKNNNGKLNDNDIKELSSLEYKLNHNDIFLRKTDNFGNIYIVGENDYINSNTSTQNLSFNPNGEIFRNIVGKYVDRNGRFYSNKNYKMLSYALISYRKDRDAAWMKLYKTYGTEIFNNNKKNNLFNKINIG